MIRFRVSWKWIPLAFLILFLLMFLVFEMTGIFTINTAEKWIKEAGPLAGFVIVLLLVSDLVTPVPSSILMTFSGSLYGIWGGTFFSTVGSVGASVIGFLLGRFGKEGVSKIITRDDLRSMDGWFYRWGEGILILSRMIPMVTETMSCFAGITDISFRRFLLLILVGTVPMTFFYAYVGHMSESVSQWALPLILGIVVPGIAWIMMHSFLTR